VTIDIRLALPDDATQLWQLICNLAAFQGQPNAVRITSDQLRNQMLSPTPPFECLVAEESNVLIGFALFFHNYSTWEGERGIYLEDFYVCDQYRGAGVGKMLLCALASLALERQCARIDWNVLTSNQTALDFYQRIGASSLSSWLSQRLDRNGMTALTSLETSQSHS
jgi:GNAT superfamily N-acetyltransferase